MERRDFLKLAGLAPLVGAYMMQAEDADPIAAYLKSLP